MKRIRINEEYCIGCRLCEVHCLVQHSRSRKLIKAFREERDLIEPRLRVEQMGYHSFALQAGTAVLRLHQAAAGRTIARHWSSRVLSAPQGASAECHYGCPVG